VDSEPNEQVDSTEGERLRCRGTIEVASVTTDRHDGRVVIVTGAASGIGRGIARQFGQEGANVVVGDLTRDPKIGENFDTEATVPTDELIEEETGNESLYVEVDVSEHEEVRTLVDRAVDRFGRVDVLVNNAGIHIPGDSQELTVEEWDQVLGVNLDGAFYGVKYAVPHLVETQGDIINISSINASEGGAGPPYASSKAAIANLTRDLAVELGHEGVNVNVICPGVIETPMNDFLTDDEIERMKEQTLLPRLGLPKDIGTVATFLASEDASFIHGEAIYVDGGWTAHR